MSETIDLFLTMPNKESRKPAHTFPSIIELEFTANELFMRGPTNYEYSLVMNCVG